MRVASGTIGDYPLYVSSIEARSTLTLKSTDEGRGRHQGRGKERKREEGCGE